MSGDNSAKDLRPFHDLYTVNRWVRLHVEGLSRCCRHGLELCRRRPQYLEGFSRHLHCQRYVYNCQTYDYVTINKSPFS